MIMSGPRTTLLLATMTLVACAGPSADPVHRVRGPIAARILQPAALIFPSPRPARASLPSSGERRALVDLQYSSIFEQNATLEGAARFDGEVGRLAANLLLGLGEGAAIPALQKKPSIITKNSRFYQHNPVERWRFNIHSNTSLCPAVSLQGKGHNHF